MKSGSPSAMAVAAMSRSAVLSGLAPAGDNRGRDAPEDAGRLGAEGSQVELALGALQYFQAAGALGVLVVYVLVAFAANLARPGETHCRR